MNQAHDTDAEALWRRFHAELLGFLRPRVPSEEMAEDILQNAFLRAHQHIASGEIPANPRAWLYQIARNLLTDAHRRAGRRRGLTEAVSRDPTARFAEAEAPVEDAASPDDAPFGMVARVLPVFIDTLDPPYREALRMTELEGLTQAEAARRAGVSLSGMKSRVQRARRRVYQALEQCCAFEVDARGRVIDCELRLEGGCAELGCGGG